MMQTELPASFAAYNEIWLVDFEFHPDEDGNPSPVCLVAHEIRSGRTQRLWRDQFGTAPPYPTSSSALFVAYYASAEIGCHLALGWPVPERILDLFTEFRCATNGKPTVAGNGLIGALTHHGLDAIAAAEKQGMRDLVLGGGPWNAEERIAILDYCQSDVVALARLLPAMAPDIDLPRALLRGRYMAAAARIERNGVPIDLEYLGRLRSSWDAITLRLIARVDAQYCIYDQGTFKYDRFQAWLQREGLAWPRLASGRLDLSDDAFRQLARSNKKVATLHELRYSLGQLRLNDIAAGRDGRNRTMLSAFRAKTSRNQPSNTKFIFGPSTWLRGLIKPPPDTAVAYIDWKQQEFGIAAALSGDSLMQEAYLSGDPYLAFAKQAGAVPLDATKASHPEERERFKACVLAVQYGMGEHSLAQRIGQPPIVARDLLNLHHQTYSTFWSWSDAMLDETMLTGRLQTVFGWPIHIGADANPRSLRNFPMQANGAEMLRLACCMASEQGIKVCAPVHDAVLICAPLHQIDDAVARMQAIMVEASRIVLGGFGLGSDVVIVRYPDRYMDKRGIEMWNIVSDILAEIEIEPEASKRGCRAEHNAML